MITGINGSKTLTTDISCKCKCEFHGSICNSDQWWIMINVHVNKKKLYM